MLTIEGLKKLGTDPEDGIKRCMGNEEFYLKLVGMALDCPEYEKLHDAINRHSLKEAFEYAHALKGVTGNVSLTTLYAPVYEMTEALRHQEERDYSMLLEQMETELEKLRALREE